MKPSPPKNGAKDRSRDTGGPAVTAACAALLVFVSISGHASGATRVRLQAGTSFTVRLDDGVSTRWTRFSGLVRATLVQDILTPDGRIVLPAGTKVKVAIVESKRAGHLVGRAKLRLRLHSVVTPEGREVPLDGYPNQINGKRVDREGTARGRRGWGKDVLMTITGPAVGAGIGLQVGGPWGLPAGAGGGVLVAGAWTVIRRGPDLEIPAHTTIEFVLGRPVTLAATEERVLLAENSVSTAAWGADQIMPPSLDLRSMIEASNTDPAAVLRQLQRLKFKNRPSVDKTFGIYLEGLCRLRLGEKAKAAKLLRQAFLEARTGHFPPEARAEIARNLVLALRAADPNWAADPLLSDPEVQSALVQEEP